MTAMPTQILKATPQAGQAPARAPHTLLALLLIALLVALTQFGALAKEVIDPDESSFILMGADVAKGHLPFVQMFDLKPPMIFLLLGATIALFGKSLVAVRLVGDLFLFATAALIFLTARRATTGPAALGAALLYVAVTSLDFGQPTYSELPATAFLMGAALLLARAPVTLRAAAVAGLLVALSVLTRTNLYPVPVATGLLLLVAGRLRAAPVAPWAWLAFGLAGLAPPALLTLVYALAGQLATLKLAMIDVPLAYSGQIGPVEVLRSHMAQFYVWLTMAPAVLIPVVLLAGAGTAAAAWNIWRHGERAWPFVVFAILALAATVAILVSGAAYPHYWLQLLPIVCLLTAYALATAGRLVRPAALALVLVLPPLGSALVTRTPEALALAAAPRSYDAHYEVAAAARHIAASGVARPRVWAWYKHLILWDLDAPQLSRAGVHPDNLGRKAIIDTLADHGYVSHDEIGRIMASPPNFVVTDTMGRGLAWLRATGKPIDAWLAGHYRLDARFGEVLVYRRVG